jgi:DNA-binding NarL/FixJ family response regulator
MVTVLIVARDAWTRDAVRAALDPADVRVVAQACGSAQGGEQLRALAPDAAVVGVNLLCTREFFLTGWGPVSRDVRIIAVGPDDPHLARLLLAHGAAAYVAVDRLAAELPACLAGSPARA